ncbi:MAG: hypothetical protein CMK36_07475 [Porticoccaceae bacterium]|jgi:hypothetical protein|nr:hypothetical protein [Porticoccaceae bacterium]
MAIPKSVTIAGHRIAIKRQALDDCYGQYRHDERIILLNSSIAGKELALTLRHEMVEASLLLSGVGWCDRYEQEAVVRCMDEVFFPAWERTRKKLKL